ncbi:NeuD/PglB/VioB family sugar acetyltransferase [Lacibacter sp. H407]|uniref:NeuD/PglB/VioB family sugar acetyltransferase n=1 Tax=Lacibacter sp. H407 TaxID=3133423 RepID=UPI0030BD1D37
MHNNLLEFVSNTNEKRICIVGAGGFGREVFCIITDVFRAYSKDISDRVCFMVGDKHYEDKEIMGIPVIRQSEFQPSNFFTSIAIGDPEQRKSMVDSLPFETEYISIIHPSAIVSSWVEIGLGSIITAGVIMTCNIKIGKHAQLNLNTTIGHDCNMGDFFTTAPGVNVSGHCEFGNQVYFGTNSSVRQGITITDNVTIGMGGVVVKNITESGVYIGNPLKKLEKK